MDEESSPAKKAKFDGGNGDLNGMIDSAEVVTIETTDCNVCQIYGLKMQYAENHFKGQRHAKNVKKATIDPSEPVPSYDCTICEVKCTSQNVLDMHLQGAKHKKKL